MKFQRHFQQNQIYFHTDYVWWEEVIVRGSRLLHVHLYEHTLCLTPFFSQRKLQQKLKDVRVEMI